MNELSRRKPFPAAPAAGDTRHQAAAIPQGPVNPRRSIRQAVVFGLSVVAALIGILIAVMIAHYGIDVLRSFAGRHHSR